MTWIEWIDFFFPCSRWMRTYKVNEYLQPDLMAGITVGIMLVPQVLYNFFHYRSNYELTFTEEFMFNALAAYKNFLHDQVA